MLEPLEPTTLGQPCYEVIKREDLVGAFYEALARALTEVLARIDRFIDIYTSIETATLWVWDYSSRWDYDMWW
jgi:hypothetical protein